MLLLPQRHLLAHPVLLVAHEIQHHQLSASTKNARRLGNHLRCLLLAFGIDDLGAPRTLGFGLLSDGANHALVQVHVFDLHVADLYSPGIGLGIEDALDIGIESLAAGEHVIQFVLAMVGSVTVAVLAVDRVGGMGALLDRVRELTAGGNTLANVLSQTKRAGAVSACGLAESMELPTSVAPFILRGVTLYGIDSVMCPMSKRLLAWQRLDTEVSTPLEKTLYANSITLTPGTLTTDVRDDHFMIHSLCPEGIEELRKGEMEKRIRRLGV